MRLGLFKNKNYDLLPKLYKGTNWFTLSYDCIVYISRYLEDNPWYLNAFNESFCGDEVFFHTIVMNSVFAETIYKMTEPNLPLRALRYIDWESGPEYPKILNCADLESIHKKDVLFARKISEKYNYNELVRIFG
ncbi:beta-1,6-N-acetylglucosaminyltransferase [Vibrio breoganii]